MFSGPKKRVGNLFGLGQQNLDHNYFLVKKNWVRSSFGSKKNVDKKKLVGIFMGHKKFGSEIFRGKKKWVRNLFG